MKSSSRSNMEKGMALGLVFGCAIGLILDNIGVWLAIGLVLGAGIGKRMDANENETGT